MLLKYFYGLFFFLALNIGHGMKPMAIPSGSGSTGSKTPSYDSSSDKDPEVIEKRMLAFAPNSFNQLPLDKIQSGIQIFILNVDQGNCIFIKNYNTSTPTVVILDCGSSNLKGESGESKIETFLTNYAFYLKTIFANAALSHIIITHSDTDHFNLLNEKFANYY